MITDCIKACQVSLDVLYAPEKRKKGKKENGKQQRLPGSFVLLIFFLPSCALLILGFLYNVLTVSFTESVRHRHGVMKRVLR